MDQAEPTEHRITRRVEVKVKDVRGREYRLEREGDGVKITTPVQLRIAPINIADLRAALDELER